MGESSRPPPQPTETDDGFVAEVSDLRDSEHRLAHRAAFWSARAFSGKGLTARQHIVRGLSAASAVVLALLAITFSVRGLPSLHLFEWQPPQPTALHVSTADMSFLQDMAWSHDGKRIALLGCLSDEVGPCQNPEHYVPNAVLVYDAASGRLVARIHPDGPVLAELHVLDPTDVPALSPTGAGGPAPTLVGVQINAFQVLWAPDGRRLALLFQANVPFHPGQRGFWDGIVLVDSDGSHARALFDPLEGAFPLWNLATGVPVPLQSRSEPYMPPASQSFPAAMAYRWGANGALILETPLVPNVVPPPAPLTPVGNPDGGTSFTLWQPGTVTPVTNGDPTAPPGPPPAYSFNVDFVAWSPHDNWFVRLGASAVLVPRGQQPPKLPPEYNGPGQPGQVDYLPVRDKTLQHLLDLGPVPNVAESGWDVAWRPDGRALAAYGISTTPDSPHPVTLYDCATGRTLATLQPLLDRLAPDGFNGGLLRWSPDGTRLLSYIQRTGITIWGPGLLP